MFAIQIPSSLHNIILNAFRLFTKPKSPLFSLYVDEEKSILQTFMVYLDQRSNSLHNTKTRRRKAFNIILWRLLLAGNNYPVLHHSQGPQKFHLYFIKISDWFEKHSMAQLVRNHHQPVSLPHHSQQLSHILHLLCQTLPNHNFLSWQYRRKQQYHFAEALGTPFQSQSKRR